MNRQRYAAVGAMFALALLAGCGLLLPKAPAAPTLFALEGEPVTARPTQPVTRRPPPPVLQTLTVDTPRAAAGYDSDNIAYRRRPQSIAYYAQQKWVDTPAQMLAPLIVRAVERTGAFRAVLRAPSGAVVEWRLDTELVRLQQEFDQSPSQVRLTLRAVLIDSATRRVAASREFDLSVVSGSEDAAGGVAAANHAVSILLLELADFCAMAAGP